MIEPDYSTQRTGPGATSHARRVSLVGGVAALVLLSALAINGWMGNQRAVAARAAVAHSHAVLRRTLDLEAAFARMGLGHRGFLVNGDPAALAERDAGHAAALALITGLREATRDNPYQQRRLSEVDGLIEARYATMRAMQQVAARDGLASAQASFRASGKSSSEPIRKLLTATRAHEDALLRRRGEASARDSTRLDNALLFGTAVAFAVLVLAGVALLRQLNRTEVIGEQLQRYSADLDNLFRLSRDLICVSSIDGRFLRLNPAWEKTLGLPLAQMVGRPFLEFVHPDDIASTRRESLALAEGRETVSFENRYRSADGRWRWMLWNAAADLDAGVIYATARDITERKHAEQRIDALNVELQARSQALEAANHELESFSYSVSHDLRAPLRHVDGYARMLIEDAGDRLLPEDRRYLTTITESVRRMGALIDDLLALSRYGRKPLDRQPVDMAALARDSLRDLAPPLPEIRIGALPVADGDPALLRQVWSNLLSNAVKYSAPRGEKACVEVDGEAVDGVLRYRVRDNGVGFDMRHAGKLFGVFQRLHGEDRFEGTGVGLAIVQRVVRRHGGDVTAEAQLDRGATFTFELPAAPPLAA
ncbi:MAG: sensor histidine kinase [Arenimonas sp.]